MTDAVVTAAHGLDEQPLGRRPSGLATIMTFAALVVLAGVVLLPIVSTALGGFKDLGELHSNPIGLPHVWVWSNIWTILTSLRNCRGSGNSLLIPMAPARLPLGLA